MEDDIATSLDGKVLGNMRVVDLKQELEKRGLSKSGSKKDLVKRLKQQLEFEKLCEERKSTKVSEVVPNLELDAEIQQNEFVQQYLAQQRKRYAEREEEKRIEAIQKQTEGNLVSSSENEVQDGEVVSSDSDGVIGKKDLGKSEFSVGKLKTIHTKSENTKDLKLHIALSVRQEIPSSTSKTEEEHSLIVVPSDESESAQVKQKNLISHQEGEECIQKKEDNLIHHEKSESVETKQEHLSYCEESENAFVHTAINVSKEVSQISLDQDKEKTLVHTAINVSKEVSQLSSDQNKEKEASLDSDYVSGDIGVKSNISLHTSSDVSEKLPIGNIKSIGFDNTAKNNENNEIIPRPIELDKSEQCLNEGSKSTTFVDVLIDLKDSKVSPRSIELDDSGKCPDKATNSSIFIDVEENKKMPSESEEPNNSEKYQNENNKSGIFLSAPKDQKDNETTLTCIEADYSEKCPDEVNKSSTSMDAMKSEINSETILNSSHFSDSKIQKECDKPQALTSSHTELEVPRSPEHLRKDNFAENMEASECSSVPYSLSDIHLPENPAQVMKNKDKKEENSSVKKKSKKSHLEHDNRKDKNKPDSPTSKTKSKKTYSSDSEEERFGDAYKKKNKKSHSSDSDDKSKETYRKIPKKSCTSDSYDEKNKDSFKNNKKKSYSSESDDQKNKDFSKRKSKRSYSSESDDENSRDSYKSKKSHSSGSKDIIRGRETTKKKVVKSYSSDSEDEKGKESGKKKDVKLHSSESEDEKGRGSDKKKYRKSHSSESEDKKAKKSYKIKNVKSYSESSEEDQDSHMKKHKQSYSSESDIEKDRDKCKKKNKNLSSDLNKDPNHETDNFEENEMKDEAVTAFKTQEIILDNEELSNQNGTSDSHKETLKSETVDTHSNAESVHSKNSKDSRHFESSDVEPSNESDNQYKKESFNSEETSSKIAEISKIPSKQDLSKKQKLHQESNESDNEKSSESEKYRHSYSKEELSDKGRKRSQHSQSSSSSSSQSSDSSPKRRHSKKNSEVTSQNFTENTVGNKISKKYIDDKYKIVKKDDIGVSSITNKKRLKIKRDNIPLEIISLDKESAKKASSSRSDEKISSHSAHDIPSPQESSKSKELKPEEIPYIPRKINLSNRKLSRKSSEDQNNDSTAKKGKWASFASYHKASNVVSISTDSLKTWFPEFKLTTEATPSMDFETDDQSMQSVDGKNSNLVYTDISNDNDDGMREESMSQAIMEESEPMEVNFEESSDQGPVSRMIFIQNLVRPFTLNQLKDLLKQNGKIIEEHFWIDKIKSKCFVMYETEKEAIKARNALNNTRWPTSNPKILSVEFSNEEELEQHKRGNEPPPPKPVVETPIVEAPETIETRITHLSDDHKWKDRERRKERERSRHQAPIREWDKDKIMQESPERERVPRDEKPRSSDKKEKKESKKRPNEDTPAKLLDDLFHKTKSTPCIYWLPLTEEQMKEKEEAKKQRRLEREKQNQLREQEAERRNRRARSIPRSSRRSREKENRKSSTRSRSPITRRR